MNGKCKKNSYDQAKSIVSFSGEEEKSQLVSALPFMKEQETQYLGTFKRGLENKPGKFLGY